MRFARQNWLSRSVAILSASIALVSLTNEQALAQNRPPTLVLEGEMPNGERRVLMNEGQSVDCPFEATDPDGDRLEVRQPDNLPSFAIFRITTNVPGLVRGFVRFSPGFDVVTQCEPPNNFLNFDRIFLSAREVDTNPPLSSPSKFINLTVNNVNHAPVITAIVPREVDVAEGTRATVTILANDPDGDDCLRNPVLRVPANCPITEIGAEFNCRNGDWTIVVTLEAGCVDRDTPCNIGVFLEDACGGARLPATGSFLVTIRDRGQCPPTGIGCTVDITSPTSGSVITSSTVEARGTITVTGAIPPITITGDVNGIPATVTITGPNTATFTAIVPCKDTLSATFRVVDIQQNMTICQDRVNVNCRSPFECKIDILCPKKGQVICADSVEVCINTEVTGGVPPFNKVCTVNGQLLTGSCKTIGLVNGNNTIVVKCVVTDATGAMTGCEASVNVFANVMDCHLTITDPPDTVCADAIEISGTTTLTGGVRPIVGICTVNGMPASVSGNNFSATVPLRPGFNRIIAQCTYVDSLKCVAMCSDTVTVFSDPTPAECTLHVGDGMAAPMLGEIFDPESGIASVEVIEIINRTIEFEPFQRCDKLVKFRSDKIDSNQTSSLHLRIVNCAGCTSFCDPILVHLTPSQPFTFRVPHTDRYLYVKNHGLTRFEILLNDRKIEFVADPNRQDAHGRLYVIPSQGERTIDLAGFMAEGENHVMLTGEGPAGSSAQIIFADVPLSEVTGVADRPREAENIPRSFGLLQSYPNPFNPSTTISFEVPVGETQTIVLRVLDVQGQLVATLVDSALPAGIHNVTWDGKDLQGNRVATGVYLYQLRAGGTVLTKKMLLAK